jgi:hypothetical protein
MGNSDDFAALDDPEFLAERRRVRDTLEALTERMTRLDDEFMSRAGAKWGGTLTQSPAELSGRLARDEPEYMARWLALEVLITDKAVCADAELFDRLSALQDRFQGETLARYGVTS